MPYKMRQVKAGKLNAPFFPAVSRNKADVNAARELMKRRDWGGRPAVLAGRLRSRCAVEIEFCSLRGRIIAMKRACPWGAFNRCALGALHLKTNGRENFRSAIRETFNSEDFEIWRQLEVSMPRNLTRSKPCKASTLYSRFIAKFSPIR